MQVKAQVKQDEMKTVQKYGMLYGMVCGVY